MTFFNKVLVATQFVIIFLLLSCLANGQSKTVLSYSDEDYENVLNTLFPRNELNKFGTRFTLVLRYSPSFDGESQIVIVSRDDSINIIEYTSLSGNISNKLDEIAKRNKNLSPFKLSKLISVKKREIKYSLSKLIAWRQELLENVQNYLKTEIQESSANSGEKLTLILDGTNYEFWDYSLSGVLHFNAGNNEAEPIVKLMKFIKAEINAAK